MSGLGGWLIFVAGGTAVTGGLLVLFDDRRILVATMATQYLLVATLISSILTPQIAGAKLLVGLIASGILLLYIRSMGWGAAGKFPSNIPFSRIFRFVSVFLVLLIAIGLSENRWIVVEGLRSEIILSTTFLICFSLLHLGLCEEPIRVGIGLLTLLSGFEITYSLIEPSLAVIGLLASVHVGIALVTGYLTLIQETDDVESETLA